MKAVAIGVGSIGRRLSAVLARLSIIVRWCDALAEAGRVIVPSSRVHIMARKSSVDIGDDLDFRIAQMFNVDRDNGVSGS